MRAGLLASTMTLAKGAPDESKTEPAMAAWPKTGVGRVAIQTRMTSAACRFRNGSSMLPRA